MYIKKIMGDGPTILKNNLLVKAVAYWKAHRSADIRFEAIALLANFSPTLSVNACSRNSVYVGPGQKIVTSRFGCSSFMLLK